MNIPYNFKSGKYFTMALLLLVSLGTQAQALVKAELDYAHTEKNNSRLVDALANDKNKEGAYIDKIVLTNHCTASIEDGKVRVMPEEDFKGIAFVRYTVRKDDAQNSDCGLIIVDVANTPLPNYYKFNLFVLKNSATQFTLPENYSVLKSPLFGKIVSLENTVKKGVWEFQALDNNSGYDIVQFVYTDKKTGQAKLHEVNFEVLREAHTCVSNDIYFTMIGKKIVVDISKNDNKAEYKEITIGNAYGGTVKDMLWGKVEFTPARVEAGIAYFEYFVTKQNGSVEKGIAYVVVSNFLPAKDVYEITTTAVPTLIRYASPVSDYSLEVHSAPTSGASVKFFSKIDTSIAGVPLKGTNVLLYEPNLNAGVERDAFYIKYCPNNGANCSGYVQVVVNIKDNGVSGDQLCGSDCVIPGDANNDGVVNILDIFPIGLNMGVYGKPRESNDINPTDWYPRSAPNWTQKSNDINSDINLKHADTNGDGIITIGDLEAIRDNYGKYNAIIPTYKPVNEDVAVSLLPSLTGVGAGDLIEFLVTMGTPNNPVYNAKGLSFELAYEPDQIKANSLSVDFGTFNWLSRYDAYLQFDQERERGLHDAGMVRTNNSLTHGHGEVGKIRAIVDDQVHGFHLGDKPILKLRLMNMQMMNETGQMVSLPDAEVEVPITLRKKEEKIKNEDLISYPNPAKGQMNFHINGVNTISYVRLMDVTGREVMRTSNVNAKAAQLEVSSLNNGLYIAEVMTEKGRIMKKVEIVK